ncbi:hypothetical protein DL98DRAFT_590243 [Cadophora sp. DSE1049]|nr:hypothetical protein DL98DRAFT_590243 [Cadophora sp. DSE1049]
MCQGENEEKTLLASVACNDAVTWMFDALSYALAGIQSHMWEPCFEPKGPTRRLKTTFGKSQVDQKEDPDHAIFTVVPGADEKHVESHALDLTRAQYGYYAPVAPWSDYRPRGR